MTRTEATGLAKSYIAARNAQSGLDLVLVEDETLEQDFGWIFFFHSKTYMESGDPLDSVIGGGPIIVDASTGEVHPLGSGSVDRSIRFYKKYGTLHPQAELPDQTRELLAGLTFLKVNLPLNGLLDGDLYSGDLVELFLDMEATPQGDWQTVSQALLAETEIALKNIGGGSREQARASGKRIQDLLASLSME